jgi:hydroxypyruvate isomerase
MCKVWLLLFDAFLEELSKTEWPKSTRQLIKLQGLAKKIWESIDRMSLYCGALGFWQVVVAVAIVPVDGVVDARKHIMKQTPHSAQRADRQGKKKGARFWAGER